MTLKELKAKGGFVEKLTSEMDRRQGLKYEVFAPDGYRFDDELHSMVCYDMKDVRERIKYSTLDLCLGDDCGCGKEIDSEMKDLELWCQAVQRNYNRTVRIDKRKLTAEFWFYHEWYMSLWESIK